MLAALLLAFLAGAGFHAVLVAVAIAIWRDRKALDIRPAMERRPYVFRDNPVRLERMAEPPSFEGGNDGD